MRTPGRHQTSLFSFRNENVRKKPSILIARHIFTSGPISPVTERSFASLCLLFPLLKLKFLLSPKNGYFWAKGCLIARQIFDQRSYNF